MERRLPIVASLDEFKARPPEKDKKGKIKTPVVGVQRVKEVYRDDTQPYVFPLKASYDKDRREISELVVDTIPVEIGDDKPVDSDAPAPGTPGPGTPNPAPGTPFLPPADDDVELAVGLRREGGSSGSGGANPAKPDDDVPAPHTPTPQHYE